MPTDARVIKYKEENLDYFTNCPFGLTCFKSNWVKKVGSRSCRMCRYFVCQDEKRKEVVCKNTKKLRRWVSRL